MVAEYLWALCEEPQEARIPPIAELSAVNLSQFNPSPDYVTLKGLVEESLWGHPLQALNKGA
jgi:hypothetical protein